MIHMRQEELEVNADVLKGKWK
jgi:uncharacterized protein YjbJ (UPF0337 family)